MGCDGGQHGGGDRVGRGMHSEVWELDWFCEDTVGAVVYEGLNIDLQSIARDPDNGEPWGNGLDLSCCDETVHHRHLLVQQHKIDIP